LLIISHLVSIVEEASGDEVGIGKVRSGAVTIGSQAFSVSTTKIWNALLDNVVSSTHSAII